MNYILNIMSMLETAYKVYTSTFKGTNFEHKFLNKRGNHPLLLKDSEGDVTLFLPVVIGGRAIAYFRAFISSTAPQLPADTLMVLDSEAAVNSAGLKLTPKMIKILRSIDAGNPITNVSGNSYYDLARAAGFKIQVTDFVKMAVLGYVEFAPEEALVNCMTSNVYNMRMLINDKAPQAQRIEALHMLMDCTDTGTRNSSSKTFGNLTKDSNSGQVGTWDLAHMGAQLAYKVMRSSKAVDDSHEIKWRKPPKSSLWPYTLEHHWFEIQESGISVMNAQLIGLLECSGGSSHAKHQKASSIHETYPTFTNITGLGNARKLLELYFMKCLSGKEPFHSLQSEVGNCHMRHLRNNHYGREAEARYLVSTLMLVCGVKPVFEGAQFVRFEAISSSLEPVVPGAACVEVPIGVFESGSLDKWIPMLAMYQLGLVSEATLRSILPTLKSSSASDTLLDIQVGPGLVAQANRKTAILACSAKIDSINRRYANSADEPAESADSEEFAQV